VAEANLRLRLSLIPKPEARHNVCYWGSVLRVPVRYYRQPPAYYHGWRQHYQTQHGAAPAPRGQPPQSGSRDVQRPAAAPAPPQQGPPAAQPQAQQPPQKAAQRQQEAPKAQPQGQQPQQGPGTGGNGVGSVLRMRPPTTTSVCCRYAQHFALAGAWRYHVWMNARHTVLSQKTPGDITSPGWREVLKRTCRAASSQHSSLDAAGIAFFGVWALFPALAALVGLGGLLFGRPEILHLLSRVRIGVPESFAVVVVGQLQAIASHSRAVSSATLIGGFVIAQWSSMRAMRGLIAALNFIYGEEEKRTFWHRQALIFAFTCFGGAFLLIVLALILAVPPWVIGANEPTFAFVAVSRWPILIVMLMVSLSALYRYGPSRPTAKWRWVSPGAAASAIIWVAGSLLFSYYTSQITHLNPMLGSLGAVTLFLLWSYLTVLTVLLGAQVNAEMERQADKDRTPDSSRSRSS